MEKRGQLAFEYIIIIGFVLAALSPLIYSQINQYIIKQRINDANVLANDIAKTADALYSLGPGNQKYMYIDIPRGVTGVNIHKREISFTVQGMQGEDQEIILLTQGYVTGTIPTHPGLSRISMQVLESGVVLIGFPYCSIQSKEFCEEEQTLNPIVYLDSSSNAMASLYEGEKGFNYTLCCKNVIEMGGGVGETSLFWLSNHLSSHVAENDETGYVIPAIIRPIDLEYILDCQYIKDEVDFCEQLGQDYSCVATLEEINYTDGWVGEVLSNSHVSDCDGDFDDYPIKVCCTIPAG